MNWRAKARLSRWVARLPPGMGNRLYGWAQRRAQSNRSAERHFHSALEVLEELRRLEIPIRDATCLEIGTGKRLVVPLALWLAGAERVLTVDAHRIREEALIRRDLALIPQRADAVAEHPLIRPERLEALCGLLTSCWSLPALESLCQVEYRAPIDTTRLPLPDHTIDFQFSYTVFEHIPPETLVGILRETARVLRPGGHALNFVDYGDHFSHRDPSLHRLNFLRFTDREWERIAGNRFHYLNRLRHDDMLLLHQQAGMRVLRENANRQPDLLDPLPPLDPRFHTKSPETLSALGAWIAATPSKQNPSG